MHPVQFCVYCSRFGSPLVRSLETKFPNWSIFRCDSRDALQEYLGASNHALGAVLPSASLSRVLAGRSLTKIRQSFYQEQPNATVRDALHSCMVGFGIHLEYQGENVQSFVSMWSHKQIKTISVQINDPEEFLSAFYANPDFSSISSGRVIFEEDLEDRYRQLVEKEIDFCKVAFDGQVETQLSPQTPSNVVLSGSFNPLHRGHVKMLDIASKYCPEKVPLFEISVVNADKPVLALDDTLDRVAQFAGRWNIALTTEPYFVDKCKFFPGSSFVVGLDTAVRIVNPKYYASFEAMVESLVQFKTCKSDFVVCNRANLDSNFTVSQLFFPILI